MAMVMSAASHQCYDLCNIHRDAHKTTDMESSTNIDLYQIVNKSAVTTTVLSQQQCCYITNSAGDH